MQARIEEGFKRQRLANEICLEPFTIEKGMRTIVRKWKNGVSRASAGLGSSLRMSICVSFPCNTEVFRLKVRSLFNVIA